MRLADLERGRRHYEWELPPEWLRLVFEGTDASATEAGLLRVDASETSRQILIRGSVKARVTMPCARTLDPVPVDLSADVFLLLRPAAGTEGSGPAASGSSTKRVPGQPTVGTQRSKQAKRPEVELSEEDAAEDVYYGDAAELDGFVREFLLLELPMMPLRSDLRSEERPAIPPTPESPASVDPRLQPLAEIANRLGKKST